MEDLTGFEIPSRIIKMTNGEPWEFRFDNRTLFVLDRDYSGAPGSSLQMFYALTSTYQYRNGLKITFDEFLDLLPFAGQLPQLQSLIADVAAVNKRISAGNGEAEAASPSPLQSAGDAVTTTGE